MSSLLTLSRAARLVGVTRGALQKKIKDGELATFEGMVQPGELLRVYPQARLEDNALLEKLTELKDGAFARRLRERILPDPEVLAVRVTELGRELAESQDELKRYRAASHELENRLQALIAQLPAAARPLAEAVRDHFRKQLLQVDTEAGHHQLAVRESFMRVMVAHVQVVPSQREFFVEGSDNLLDAALRSGLALNYGCSNGNCGLCKARVVTGQVKKVRNHDYVLSEAEKHDGMVLMCCNTAVTDCVIEAEEAGSAQEIPLQQIATRVKSIDRLAPDLVRLHVQTPRTRRLRFLAGQYVTLQTGDTPAVDYPIASCPCDDRNLQFHIHRMPDNPFAEHVLDSLKNGDTVQLLGPRGDFVLNEDSPRALVFIAWDTGFAPIKSLIEHAMALDVAESIHLYWLSDSAHGHYLANQCRSWSDALDNFHFTAVSLPDAAASDPDRMRSEIERVVHDHPGLREYDFYVAGSGTLLDSAHEVFIRHGLPENQLNLGYPR
jgi:CDP-4-dehydro-6-deoxyglucose reductase